jgi:hypothetical protein
MGFQKDLTNLPIRVRLIVLANTGQNLSPIRPLPVRKSQPLIEPAIAARREVRTKDNALALTQLRQFIRGLSAACCWGRRGRCRWRLTALLIQLPAPNQGKQHAAAQEQQQDEMLPDRLVTVPCLPKLTSSRVDVTPK